MHGPLRDCQRSTLGLLLVLTALSAASARAEEPPLSEYFGFLPVEVYKIDTRINGLVLKDLDGDKVDDIIVINNARSRIDLLLTTKRGTGEGEPAKREVNHVPSDRRMRLVSVPVNKEVVSVQAGDMNGDGKADLVFYGNPAEVVVLYNEGKGRFGDPKKVNSGEAVERGGALTLGDLNRDGRDDIALLGANELVLIYQGEKGKLSEPERLPHTASNPWMHKAVDLDGNGGDDLVILESSNDNPFRIRFATDGGKLGPEQRFAAETPRAIAFGQIDGKPGMELLSVEGQSGRVKVLTLADADEDDAGKRGRLIFYPLPQGNERGRSLAVGDIDGDGKVDVVVTDPANAQFLVHRQSGRTGLGASQTFPGLLGGKTVRLADLDGDRKAEAYVLSEQEKQIGRSTFADGRLTFPAPLPISGDPVALDVADLDGDKRAEVVYIARTKTNGSDAFTLKALARDKAGDFVPFRWGAVDNVALSGLSGVPPALRVLDANQDKQADVLVFNAFGSPLLLLGRPGEPPAPAGGGLGPFAGVTPAGLTIANMPSPALIVAQNTFARNLLLDKEGHWEVKDQYNTGRGSAQVVGAAVLDADANGTKEVVLLDRISKSLLFLDKKEGVYRPGGSLPVGPIEFQGMHVADFDGDGREDLLIAGTDKFGVVLTGQRGQRLKAIASYESERTDARLGDLAAGDLNDDGQPDILLTDIGEHFAEIVTYRGQPDLVRATAFKIFERKTFRGMNDGIEPRDLAVGDVDGDRRNDFVLIVHDRILVYRQDSGKDQPAKKK
jgi:hypothetical protein